MGLESFGNEKFLFFSKHGSYFGKLDSLEQTNVELLYNHIKASLDPQIALKYSKAIISSKVYNSRVMLQRWTRFKEIYGADNQIQRLKEVQTDIAKCDNIDALRGYEGSSARIYFNGFAKFIKEPFKFESRNRRPPKDPVNAMLSLGYTLLAQTIQMILDIQGINTQIGFFHQPKDLRTLLVLDMMEMYRAWIVDDMVLRILENGKIRLENFEIIEDNSKRPVLLDDDGLKAFLSEYYKTIFKGKDEMSIHNTMKKLKIIEKNIEAFKQTLVNKSFDYEGFKIK
ncbi:CRISPR-associated endonuclease Cas1 [Candidatus Absconditicoccus praedator]|uniref:CRISPR-associated endonuclease Cas1 n=1 Tax=Candidatus Absconditicoccus praedator TaxID=2735562 RepID=UPI001E470100|nr:CRISPR-associated endonuclease Cas1 [Candidatus Absconditicoccus praedator]UFX83266.1 CRISPR-associated endonuclease Cas1 [Candidatus Absconditicoccus praedator]